LLTFPGTGAIGSLSAQDEVGTAAAAVGGAALGAFSGLGLGLVGSLVPCGNRVDGLTCARVAGLTGGAIGAASGAVIGARDSDLILDHVGNAAIGAVAGGITGLVLQGLVRHYGWFDTGTGIILGAAFGAAPRGAGIGFATGAVVGGALFLALPQVEMGDAVGISLLGLAAGGLAEWIHSAANSGSEGKTTFDATLLTFRF
jgi:hypothetical protein